jgi:hypothetical protein
MLTLISPKAMLIAASEDTVRKLSSRLTTSRARGKKNGARGPQRWGQKRELESLDCAATPSLWTQKLTHIEYLGGHVVAWERVSGNF